MKIKYYFKAFLLCLLICQFALSSHAQLIDYTTNLSFEKNKLAIEKSYLIQINSKQEDWIADIAIPYSEEDNLNISVAQIIDKTGNIVRSIKKKDMTFQSAISRGTFHEDDFVKEFSLKWNDYPYQIRYKYKRKIKNYIEIARWFPIIHPNIPTINASLNVAIPFDYDVSIQYDEGIDYQLDSTHQFVHKFQISDIDAYEKQLFTPPLRELMPQVRIVPKEFNYDKKGSSESWTSFGLWQEAVIDGLDELTDSEKTIVDNLVEGLTDKKSIIETLYQHLQKHTRYVNVAIDVGGLKPYPASYVCEKKYGDCKALTIYMKAMLKHVGIPSYYTLIYAGNRPIRVKEDLPSQQFNHVLLCVPMEKDTIWLENTSDYSQIDFLGTFTQGRKALLVDGKNTKLIDTPVLDLNQVENKYEYSLDLDEKGNGVVKLLTNGTGIMYDEYCYIKNDFSEDDQKRYLESTFDLFNIEVTDWNFTEVEDQNSTLKLEVEFDAKKQIRKVANIIALNHFPFDIYTFEKPEKRLYPLRINYPINNKEIIQYKLPYIESHQVELPDNIEIRSEYGLLSLKYELKENAIILTRLFQLYRGDYPIEKYEAFYEFNKSIQTAIEKSVILFNQK